MTRGLFRLFVAVLTLLGSVAMVAGTTAPAQAQPSGSSNSTTPEFVKLAVDSVTPSTVTPSSDPVLTVAGTVTNIGDRPVEEVSVRVQRAAAITEPSQLRSTLRLDQVSYDLVGPFEDVVDELSPGQRRQFTVSIPLRSDSEASLQISEPGVYPVLLNVNGTPAYGGQARLDDARFLLPVLGVPQADPGAQLPPSPAPVATTVVWPLADRPRLVAGVTGSVDSTTVLTDDELAGSLGKGGRLDQLLGALETVTKTAGDRRLASSICLAVDPDLLVTVQAMTAGYRVLASPSDPDGATREGIGEEQAAAWLDRLRALAPTLCTVALPYAQVDPAALAAVGDPALTARALAAPAEIIDATLAVKSVRGLALPDAGALDAAGAALLRGHGYGTAVLAGTATVPEGSAGTGGTAVDLDYSYGGSWAASDPAPAPDVVRLPGVSAAPVAGGGPAAPDLEGPPAAGPPQTSAVAPAPVIPEDAALRVTTFDIWSATALAAVGSNPSTPSFTPGSVRYEVTNDSRTARLQDALGAITWRAVNPQAVGARSLLMMPPQQWGASGDEATAVLRQVESLIRAGLATPRALTDLVAQAPDPVPYELDYSARAASDAVPGRFVEPTRVQGRRITDLFASLVSVPELKPTPSEFLTPLRDDLLRVLTLSDRRSGTSDQPDTWARRRLDQTTRTLDELYRSVTVLPPGGVYTLATEQSPLLLVARNDLPVPIRIRFRIEAPDGANITDLGEQQLPPNGTRSFRVPTEVSDSRNLVIPISVTTADGVLLGESTSVSVRSNAYGQILAIITACAAVLLFGLAGRRLYHRFRGRPDPADE